MDDLIRRQAAIDAFLTELTKRERKNLLHTWSTVEVKYFVVDMLEKLPSAQPERKKGEWIEISLISHSYKCSECGRLLVNITDGKNNVARNYPYCHCGADMRGE